MGEIIRARTSGTHGRRGLLARALLGTLAAMVLLVVPVTGAGADVSTITVSVAGSTDIGDSAYLTASIEGAFCAGTAVTFSFQEGSDSKTISAVEAGSSDSCTASAGLLNPRPAACPAGGTGTVTAVAEAGGVQATSPWTVTCPSAGSPTPSATKTPTPSHPATQTATPTPTSPTQTPTATTSASQESPSSSPAGTPSVDDATPRTDAPTVARQAALVVPVDDGGPQPPDPAGGRSLSQQLLALVLLLFGAVATLLAWQRGATRAVVGGLVAGTFVLAAAPLVVPAVTATSPTPSTAVRVRPVPVEQDVDAGSSATATATCPAGSSLVGGGVRATGPGAATAVISASLPTTDGWTATASSPNAELTLTAVAFCTTDVGVATSTVASLPASLAKGDTARTQARCTDGSPLALGWSGLNAPAVAGLPLSDGGTVISWGAADAATSITNVLCTASGATTWPVRAESEQVEVAARAAGHAEATCPVGTQAVGGGYIAAASIGGRVAPVTVMTATPDGESFDVDVATTDASSSVLLTAYALCLTAY